MNSLMPVTPTEHTVGAIIIAETAEMTTETVTEKSQEKSSIYFTLYPVKFLLFLKL